MRSIIHWRKGFYRLYLLWSIVFVGIFTFWVINSAVGNRSYSHRRAIESINDQKEAERYLLLAEDLKRQAISPDLATAVVTNPDSSVRSDIDDYFDKDVFDDLPAIVPEYPGSKRKEYERYLRQAEMHNESMTNNIRLSEHYKAKAVQLAFHDNYFILLIAIMPWLIHLLVICLVRPVVVWIYRGFVSNPSSTHGGSK